jgi:putative ABC transport system ATP-binding protein
MEPALLRLRGVTRSYQTPTGPIQVLDGVDLDLARGETLALTGESGSGKSTLLHLIAGLDAADGGSISVEGAEVTAMSDTRRAHLRRDRIGIVFQQFNLIPSLSVGANMSFQARLAGREDKAWNAELAARLGLADLLDRWPEQLSGGQQQRAAIGRALAARPALVMADEPTGNLDEASADAVLALLRDLAAGAGCGLLMVTQSAALAARLDRRVHLRAGRLAAPQ